MKRRTLLLGAAAAPAIGWAKQGRAAEPLRLGVLNDMSGVYADFQGIGSVIAAQFAVEDFGGKMGDRPIEVISGDHQNKPDTGMTIARDWLDNRGVDILLDVPNSAVALAVADLVRQKNKVFLGSGAGTADLTGKACSPNTVHWTYDTWEIGNSMGRAVSAQGGKRWFMLVADYSFGYDLEKSMGDAVRAAGGTVVGSARHPLGNADFSSFLVQAQNSGADVLGLANAGGDTNTTLKQATEFGLTRKMRMAGPVVTVNTVKALGLPATQGLLTIQAYLLGPERRDPRLCAAFPGEASAPQHAERPAGRRLFRHARLSARRRCAERAIERRPRGGGADEARAFDRPALRHQPRARGRACAASRVPARDEDAGREQGRLGLLQDRLHDLARGCLAPAFRRRLPTREELGSAGRLTAAPGARIPRSRARGGEGSCPRRSALRASARGRGRACSSRRHP